MKTKDLKEDMNNIGSEKKNISAKKQEFYDKLCSQGVYTLDYAMEYLKNNLLERLNSNDNKNQ